MFDLEREVAAWSEAVHAESCGNAAHAAELSDHLHCEIERARAEGMSDEQAFRTAVSRLGARRELSAEEAKNRSLLGVGCAAAARYDGSYAARDRRGLFLGHALLWAALILATSLLLSKSSTPDSLSWLIIGVMVPIWWASQELLRWALRPRPTGRAE